MLKLQTLKIYIQNVELTGLVLVAGSSSPVAWAFHLRWSGRRRVGPFISGGLGGGAR
jgi:hypothetical protein